MVVRTLLYGASITMLMLMIPFVNSLGMETIRQGEELDYGIGAWHGFRCICDCIMAARPADRILWSRHDSDLGYRADHSFSRLCIFVFRLKGQKKAEAEKEEDKSSRSGRFF